MDDYELLIDLHLQAQRQGPGSDTETLRALQLARLDPQTPLKVADIGCGTGASTLVLATHLNARITAVDLFPEFLDELQKRAQAAGLDDRISTLACSMDELPFAEAEFDVLWSEGAIYNMGFEKGVSAWRRFLKPGGLLAVSEITWITGFRPSALQEHWEGEYPEIDVASAKIRILEKQGYSPAGYFVLPDSCWLDHYYRPMQERFEAFLQRHGHSDQTRAIVAAEEKEIALYEQHRAHYSYGMYLARKV